MTNSTISTQNNPTQEHDGITNVPCPICKSTKSRHLFWTKDYVFRVSEHHFGVRRCEECGGGYLSPRPSPEAIGEYYPEAFYWSWEGADGKLDWAEIVDKRRLQLASKAEWLSNLSPGRLLDIGAQKGEFIWYMQQKGWDVQGVEFDPKVPNPVGLPIRYGDFLEMDFSGQTFDVVTLWAVLEHVYNPAQFIEKASKLLRTGGHLVVLVTNLNSIQSRYYRSDDFPRHLTLFTRSSVEALCEPYGFKMQRVRTDQDIFGGSLNGGLVYLTKRLCGYEIDEVMTEWKQLDDPYLFWCKWRGNDSTLIKWISRLDRGITYPLEKILDRLGFGFILTFSAIKGED